MGAALATLCAVRGGDHPLRADLRGSDLPVPGSACRTHRPADAAVGRRSGPADSRCPAGTPGPGCHPRSAGNVRSAARRPRSDAGTAPPSGRPTTAAGGPRCRGAPSGARNAGGNTWNADGRARRRVAGARTAGGAARTWPGGPATATAGHPAATREAERRGTSSVRHPAPVADAVGGSRATAASADRAAAATAHPRTGERCPATTAGRDGRPADPHLGPARSFADHHARLDGVPGGCCSARSGFHAAHCSHSGADVGPRAATAGTRPAGHRDRSSSTVHRHGPHGRDRNGSSLGSSPRSNRGER